MPTKKNREEDMEKVKQATKAVIKAKLEAADKTRGKQDKQEKPSYPDYSTRGGVRG